MASTFPDLVVSYLKSLENRGIVQIPIDDEARSVLRKWVISARAAKASISPTLAKLPPKPIPDPPPSSNEANDELSDTSRNTISSLRALLTETPQEMPEENNQPNLTIPELAGNSLEENLTALRLIAERWQPARILGTLRETMVFATGNPHTDLMLIGEAPGFQEERLREPFVGPAGEKLNAILKAMGRSRDSIYISNIVKFRPSLPHQTTNNRAPNEREIAYCLPIIAKEIELIRPKVIVALGATAAKGLLGTTSPLSTLRGRFHYFRGVPVRVTYHPSYLLRNEELSERRKVWEDMLAVMELLGMPISDKQREYFRPKQH